MRYMLFAQKPIGRGWNRMGGLAVAEKVKVTKDESRRSQRIRGQKGKVGGGG